MWSQARNVSVIFEAINYYKFVSLQLLYSVVLICKSTLNEWDINEIWTSYIIGSEVIETKCCGHFIILQFNILYYFVPLWEAV